MLHFTTCGQLVQDAELLSNSTTSTVSLMETDQNGDENGRRGNPKERMPEIGTFLCLISKSIPGWHL
jgi:hypothetical protein